MQIIPYKLRVLLPPQDSLEQAIKEATPVVKEGDVVAISSKVVSIAEGRCVLPDEAGDLDALAYQESEWYVPRQQVQDFTTTFTVTRGAFINRAGIDKSNGNGYYILYPLDPTASAQWWCRWLKRTYGLKKAGVIITDSHSVVMRRGAVGFALAHAGFAPLKDYRGTKDIFGRRFHSEAANVADSLAAAAVLAMGEGREQTPLAVISGAPVVWKTPKTTRSYSTLELSLEDDKHAVFFKKITWRKGGGGYGRSVSK